VAAQRVTKPRLTPVLAAAIVIVATLHAWTARAADPQPVSYTIRFASLASHLAGVEARVPTDGRPSIDLMMPTWSPGFYRVENYATRIQDISARTATGVSLAIEHPQANRWHVQTRGAASVIVSYRLLCNERSVTTNFVGEDYAVLTGGATFITLVEQTRTPRPHDVTLELPTGWTRSMTGLDPAPDRAPNHYRAPDFDTLVDSPIVAGNPIVQTFDVGGSRHEIVEIGNVGAFDGARAAADLKKVVEAHRQIWGELPFKKYDFLLVFRQGGGGLEHKNSMLATSNATATDTAPGYARWLNFISHEYCHAFNVKRLRPAELGPFDYEREPHTESLWISEGFTSYFGNLAVTRAGLTTAPEFLASLSAQIRQLQNAPGRLVQTLAQSSLDVWTSESVSGVNTNVNTSVSYYIKGQIAGFLLDAEIRRATEGAKSLDDLMRLAYRRYGGERGFTPEQFRAAASEVAGRDLSAWFRQVVSSTDELDYTAALDWFGLRFVADSWTLAVRQDATPAQKDHLRALLAQ
jgi:predicted metalloprotease with PDZ domain